MIYFQILLLGIIGLLFLSRSGESLWESGLLGFSFPLGLVIFSLYWWLQSALHLDWSSASLWVLFLFCILVLMIDRNKLKNLTGCLLENFRKQKITWTIGFLVLLSLGILFWGVQASNSFVHSDGMTHWFTKARIFYEDRGIVPGHLTDQVFRQEPSGGAKEIGAFFRAKYPPLVPTAMAGISLSVEQFDIGYMKWLWFLVHVSVLLSLWVVANKTFSLSNIESGLFLLLYHLIPAVWAQWGVNWFGVADTFVSSYFLFAAALILMVLRQSKSNYAYLAAIFLSAIPLIKNDGMVMLLLVPFMLYYFWKTGKIRKSLPYLLAPLPFLLWRVYLLSWPQYIEEQDFILENIQNLAYWTDRLPAIVTSFVKQFANFKLFNGVWVLFGISVWLVSKKQYIKDKILYWALCSMIIIFVLVASASPLRLDILITRAGVIERLLLQLMPTAYLLGGLGLADHFKSRRSR